jgi:undecaprenyl diphosphate synthase
LNKHPTGNRSERPAPNTATLPTHVAIIMDGNGRWARARGQRRTAGHKAGLVAVRAIYRHCLERGIGALTVFAFSSENWGRPAEEIMVLMGLFMDAFDEDVPALHRSGVRVRFVGERTVLSADLQRRMAETEALTAGNPRLNLQVALSYGGRRDIVLAAQRFAGECESGALKSHDIDEQRFAGALALQALPDPDLFIRTGGERRISNFLLWNLAYTELYFTDTLWPDFDPAAMDLALADFASRQRRFGLTGDQVPGA